MPLKDEAKKDYQRDYMRKKRSNRQGLTFEGSNVGSNAYPAIIHALADPIKRAKLEKIYHSLKDFKQEKNVFYGYPRLGGVPFDVVGDYLEATR